LVGLGQLLMAFTVLPRPVRDRLYRRIARNRCAIFGRTQMRVIPGAALKQRLLT
jgi:predicted DCC family thiol-disulfide oxidoreductase YuxK